MEIKSKLDKDKMIIYLKGELDEHSALNTRQIIDGLISCDKKFSEVIFDFSQTSFMDSTGIGVLIGRYKILKKKNIPSYIKNPSFSVNKIFQISGIYGIMPKI